jgi:hypothetical protein
MGGIDWLVKDQEFYGYWVSDEFRAMSEWSRLNR